MCASPTVSVAMGTYNGASYLPAQLASILQQTVMPTEMVVCDDGSTDTTFELLEEFRSRAPFPVRLLRNTKQLGPAQNFGHCIALCTSEVILLTDQDDTWCADRVEQTCTALRDHPSAMLVYSDAPLVDDTGCMTGQTIYSTLPMRPQDLRRVQQGGDLLPVLGRYNVFCGATMAFRASLLPQVLPVPALWMHDEWIGLTGNALGAAIRLPRPAMHYRQHASQQLGAGGNTLATHLSVASKRGAAFYRNEMQRLGNGMEAVRPHPALARVLLPLFQQKCQFFEQRLRVQSSGLRGVPAFARLLVSGQYQRYSSALRSPFKDLFVLLKHVFRPGARA